MKRVCHITSAHGRYDTRIFQKECKSLAKEGYEVYLLVNDEEKSEEKEKVKIISTGFLPKNRFQRFFKSKKKMLKIALQINAEVYQFHDPDLIGFALQLKKRIPQVKIIFDSHEDVPAQMLNKEWIPVLFRKFLSNSFEIYQKRSLKKFDYLIGVTPHLVRKLKRININTKMITNYPLISQENTINRKNMSNNVICFAGGIEKQWNHQKILSALSKIEAKYILCGDGDKNYLEQLKTNPEWNKVTYLGKVPFQDVKKVYEKSSIGIAILSYSPNTNYKEGSLGNTKIFEYMQMGLPVICTDFTLWKEIIEKNKCGICVAPKDSKAIGKAIRFLINNPDRRRKMGENGKNLVYSKLNWNNESVILSNMYRDVLNGDNNV